MENLKKLEDFSFVIKSETHTGVREHEVKNKKSISSELGCEYIPTI